MFTSYVFNLYLYVPFYVNHLMFMYNLMFTIWCLTSYVYHLMFTYHLMSTIICLQSYVSYAYHLIMFTYHFMLTILCLPSLFVCTNLSLPSRVYVPSYINHLMFTILGYVYHHMFTILCLPSFVHNLMFTNLSFCIIFCWPSYFDHLMFI